jgi:hypothetical protein
MARRCFSSHSPTLRPWIERRPLAHRATDDVLRGGALEPEPRHRCEKGQAKAKAYSPTLFRVLTPRVFLSQAGPRFDLELVQAEHHLWFRRLAIAFKTTKATLWVALARLRNAARDLARTPPSEGSAVTGPAIRFEAALARRRRRDERRLGKEQVVFCVHQHRESRAG